MTKRSVHAQEIIDSSHATTKTWYDILPKEKRDVIDEVVSAVANGECSAQPAAQNAVHLLGLQASWETVAKYIRREAKKIQ